VKPDEPWGSLKWWPALAGIGLAVFIALDMSSGSRLAAVLAAAGLVYLGAAALRKPSAAWPLFFGTFLLITANKVRLIAIDATWIFLGLAALFLAYGLLRGAGHQTGGLPLQAIAMAGFGTAAAISLAVGGNVGAWLVAGHWSPQGWIETVSDS
jgi:hypothetical protein